MQPTITSKVETEPEPAVASRHLAGSLISSLAFWFALTTAAVILAAVQLSSGLIRWQHASLLHQQHSKQLQLLEQELQRLERLTATLTNDPSFAAAVRAGGHSAAAARAQLNFNHTPNTPNTHSDHTRKTATTASSNPVLPWARRIPTFHQLLPHSLLPAAHRLHSSQKLRHQLLWLAAFITIAAFTCLNDSSLQTAITVLTSPITITRQLWHRYRRIHQIPINPPEPVADPPVTIIIPADISSDSSVGRATDS